MEAKISSEARNRHAMLKAFHVKLRMEVKLGIACGKQRRKLQVLIIKDKRIGPRFRISNQLGVQG